MSFESQNVYPQLFSRNVVLPFLFLATSLVPSELFAQKARGVLIDLVRGATRVADDIPVKKMDDLIEGVSKSRTVRKAVDKELQSARRIAGSTDLIRGAARSDGVLRLLRSATSNLDPKVMRRLEKLDDASRDVAVVLARGGKELCTTLPDVASRGRLLKAGGAETVAAIGMFGPDAAKAALRLDSAVRGGAIVVKRGGRAVSVADFGRIMTRTGDASWTFWKTYVQPHWKIWTTSGALALYFSNPEFFQDRAGKLTEAGFRHLTELAGELAASAIRGVGKGSGEAARNITQATSETFLDQKYGRYAIIGTLVFLACIALLFRRIRYWCFAPLRWLNRSPNQPND